MRFCVALIAATATLLASAGAASAETVRFAPNEGSFLSDGSVGCVVGTDEDGKGSVTCAGPDVYRELWAGTSCDDRTKRGCSDDKKGLRSISLDERGKTKRGWIEGVGGVKDSERGDAIIAGGITGRHLSGGGFTFTNRSGHGLTITKDRLRRF